MLDPCEPLGEPDVSNPLESPANIELSIFTHTRCKKMFFEALAANRCNLGIARRKWRAGEGVLPIAIDPVDGLDISPDGSH